MVKKKTKHAGDGIVTKPALWSFGGDVPGSFSQHVSKSVPLYNSGQNLVLEISDFFVCPGTTIYDLGCSTGMLTAKLADRHATKDVKVIGADCEPKMIGQAELENQRDNVIYKTADILTMEIEKADFISLYYTIQFIPPKARQSIFNRLFDCLNWGGAIVIFEKVRAPDARFQDYMTQIYNEYKISIGYNEENIMEKARSLKRVLEPYSSEENYKMMERAGFKDIMTVYKYICFEGFLAIK